MMVNDICLSLQDINAHYEIAMYSSFGLRQSSRYDTDFQEKPDFHLLTPF